MFARLKIRSRLWLLIVLAWVGLSAVAGYSLHVLKDELMQARRTKTYNTLELAVAMVDNYRQLAVDGRLPEAQAKELARKAIGNLRYDSTNYFSAYSLDYHMIQHAVMPELVGKDLSDLKDANGVRIVVEMVEAAKRGKGEFILYLWPKPGSGEPVQKLATSRLYAPWGWVLQTGIYLDDVEAEFRRQVVIYGGAILVAIAVLALGSWYIARGISQPLRALQATVGKVAKETGLAGPGHNEARPQAQSEIDELTEAFDDMTIRLREAHAELEYMAASDSLTKLPNRRGFITHLSALLRRLQERVVLMFLDLDRFKEINDTLGHTVGDEVLVVIGRRLAQALRTTDLVARLGGDEFAIVLHDVDQEGIRAIAEKILTTISAPITVEGHELEVSASIGITAYPQQQPPIEELLRYADLALYQAKALGRGTFSFYTPALGEAAAKRQIIESHLRTAIALNELELHYQPKIGADGTGLAGVEVLLRWFSPVLGRVMPVDFIPIAEDSGLIVPIGLWLMEEACRQYVAWQAAGLEVGMLAVNVSPRQFRQDNLADQVAAVLQRTGMPAERLELELTEGALLDDSPEVMSALSSLHALGVRLAIDDFGTGYSSLSYLKRFPIDRLKIDRSFVQDLESDKDGRAIVGAIVAVAKSLGMQVTAEGVENPSQLQLLKDMDCDEFQGYYFAQPLTPADMETMARRYPSRQSRKAADSAAIM